MLVTKLTLKNWRNFKKLEIPLGVRTYIIGANATGKSNLLDVFRFLRDICRPAGGGLQKAIEERGGIKKLRCLQARTDIEVLIDIEISEGPGDVAPLWRYVLGFKSEGTGAQRVIVTREIVYHEGRKILNRPKDSDVQDKVRLTQTYLEQINANQDFREIAGFFEETTYLHLVPQLLKHVEIASRVKEDDPFGQGLLQRIAKTQQRVRDAKLRRIQSALENAVPQFSELKFELDKVTGLPHLMASYKHWRNYGAWQREDQFSDGTLRLIGLLWMLQESNALLLLEEPELSLNDAIVSHIPLMIDRVLRKQKASNRQVIITTHSEALLRNPLDSNSIILLEPGQDGTTARTADEMESSLMAAGLTPADVMLPKARPGLVDQLGLM
ncbi:chromosome segregation protein SMC [Pseudomonas aeruginosa]|uniref:AAA family ATPase n=1 Tax=Pseudomonas aeruginosa TaxID=287 RepID=UPI000D65BF1C|nr:ATP-binding protein [Pseudomonas aeruginosa]RQA59480.1 chromosome segregation protein SMC [Pseudomonas aeruginosa]RQA81098.1 chromosome segregation protein SMC [Pseudomonas aeruginosa]RQA97655.1 chromosome segregation protein SMC [Pseudomonas aeruginosa]RQF41415.1 chromosome segregation protein SMC [Pseudomonas aeruginosa]HBO4817469.1 AAA family ATPase [Pseudomonas aeruginosa]